MTRLATGRSARALACAVAVGAGAVAGCSNATDTLLEALDPDIINPSDLQSADGAQGLYLGAFGRLRAGTIGGTGSGAEGAWLLGGLLTDEWSTSSTFIQNDETDQRKIVENNSTVTQAFRALHRVRTSTNQAIAALREYRPTESNKLAEMYFQRGFAEMQLASDFCNGIPVSDGTNQEVVYGNPESVTEVFTRAVASFDSALALAGGTDATSILVNRAARVGKARALLGIGNTRAAEAAALVTTALVPTSFSYDLTMTQTGNQQNSIWSQGTSQRRYTIGDSVEGNARNLRVRNAIPFFSARDPRLPVTYTVSSNGRDTTKSQDGFTFSRTTTLYGELTSTPLANGLDARLIEAEARLIANDIPGMITILNALRSSAQTLGTVTLAANTLPALTAPATRDAAIDLLFREKAFWTFSRGQRLGDMRRLIRSYGRTPENTFPIGTHYRGGEYGADLNLPVPTDERVNPNSNGCTNRNA